MQTIQTVRDNEMNPIKRLEHKTFQLAFSESGESSEKQSNESSKARSEALTV